MAAEAPNFYVLEEEHHEAGSSTMLGFWIYLMSDALIFATLFATYGVLSSAFAGGPTPREIFELPLVAVNTGLLLVYGIAHTFNYDRDYFIPADEVAETENARTQALAAGA